MSGPASLGRAQGRVARTDVVAKAVLVAMLVFAFAFPDLSNVRDKAAGLRAVTYTLLAFTLPLLWWLARPKSPFPWLSDLLVTLTCFSDVLGNQLDLYDTIVWFDDWMHYMNTGLLTVAVLLLTVPRSASAGAMVERSLAFGSTAAIGWELAEFFAFLRFSPERTNGYVDTLGDLTLGVLGALTAGLLTHRWRARPEAALATERLAETRY